MPPSTRDLLASVLGELPRSEQALPAAIAAPVAERPAGPWRVTARMHGGQVQISNSRESRVVRKEQVEVYLRGQLTLR
jgi:hypothetical protein